MNNLPIKIFRFYYEGFRSMTIGKKLWLIILIKFFVIFVLLKIFFFNNTLHSRFDNDRQRSDYVIKQLTRK